LKIAVICGTGPIGTKAVSILRERGHEVVAASHGSDLAGAQTLIDVAFESFDDDLLTAAAAARVRHHIALSIVGADRNPAVGHFQEKLAQEKLIEASGIPYTIVRSTQFFESIRSIAAASAEGNTIKVPVALLEPIAGDDVAAILSDVALAAPKNGIVEIAGPEKIPFREFIARYVAAVGLDPREVISEPDALFCGGRLEERSLIPRGDSRRGSITFDEWLSRTLVRL